MLPGYRALAAAVALVLSSPVQAQKPQTQWWQSPPEGSPVQLSLNPGGRYIDLDNRSQKTITQYTLGCVLFSRRSSVVTKSLGPTKRAIAPREGILELVSWYKRRYDSCSDARTKLSVVQVVFEDGTKWSLEARADITPPKP